MKVFYYCIAALIAICSIPFGLLFGFALSVRFDSAVPLWLCLAGSVLGLMFSCHLFEQLNKKPFKPQLVRWIETRGCMGEDHDTTHGVVTREYMDKCLGAFAISEPHIEIRMSNDTVIRFPKGAFTLAGDGVLEYRY